MSTLTVKILNPKAINILDGLKSDGLIEVSPFTSAIAEFQEGMRGVAEKSGIRNENDVAKIVAEIRREMRNEYQPSVIK
jgi:uncharacterized protein YkvS